MPKAYDPKRYMTKCTDCGDTIKGFDQLRIQTCRCGKTRAWDGKVEIEGRIVSKMDKQETMFASNTDYQE